MASKALFTSFTESTDVEEAGGGERGLGTRYTPPFLNAPLIVSILQSFICQVHLLSLCNALILCSKFTLCRLPLVHIAEEAEGCVSLKMN